MKPELITEIQLSFYRGVQYPAITICYVCHDGCGNYLMNKRSVACSDEHGVWDFGGGRVELGDTIMQTVHKELFEEYGIVRPVDVQFLGYHDLFRESAKGATHWLCMIFLVYVNSDEVVNGEPHKFDELKWFTLDNLPEPLHPLAPIEIAMIHKAQSHV